MVIISNIFSFCLYFFFISCLIIVSGTPAPSNEHVSHVMVFAPLFGHLG